MKCPNCGTALEERSYGKSEDPRTFAYCERCEGVLHANGWPLVRSLASVFLVNGAKWDDDKQVDRPALACPACEQPMKWVRRDGVAAASCAQHGLWLASLRTMRQMLGGRYDVPGTDLRCDGCRRDLVAVEGGRFGYKWCACPGCGGDFITLRELERILVNSPLGKVPPLTSIATSDPPGVGPYREAAVPADAVRGCPSCRQPMQRVRLGKLVLRRCLADGLWFEPGQLESAAQGHLK
ncbi:MAG: zf-TFIIB domain-containing protein [Deltaproteobacteria bacterium]|nr:zf-TFIIB domain-containing protein [Deltaproteobacteria bacterium]